MVQDGEQQVKVHLYERTNYPDIFGAKIFTTASSYKDTFKGCTQMADYADIPIPWGGISDGTKAADAHADGRARRRQGVLPAVGHRQEYGDEIGKGSLHDESAAPGTDRTNGRA